MKHLLLIIVTLTTLSCNKDNLYEGYIYIKLIDFHGIIYSLDKENLELFKERISGNKQNDLSEDEKKLGAYCKILIQNNLFLKPFFKLKTNNGKIINVYCNEKEFSKLEKELKNLNRDSEKVHVIFKGKKIPNPIKDTNNIFNQGIYIANKIVSVKKVKGKTDWAK